MAYDYIDSVVSTYETAVKNMMNQIQTSMSSLFDDVFRDHPDLETIQWRQYTQYFNDGDECHFYVREWTLAYQFTGEDDLLTDDDRYNTPGRDAVNEKMKDFEKAFYSIPAEVMKSAYGDHAQITVTRSGIEVEEYTDHD